MLASALTSTLLPAAASAAAPTARDLDSACPPGRVPAVGFTDTRDSLFAREIACVVGYDVAGGVTSSSYAPTLPVTREQMATFLANVLEAAGRNRPANLPNAFRDDDRSAHRANIDWLANEGIIGGFADGTYRPAGLVTRAQMASFLNRVVRELTGSRLSSSTDFFADDAGSPHEANINALAWYGIATGTGPATFGPAGAVTRGQMAAFLAREVDHLVDQDVIRVPFGPDRITVTPTSSVSLDVSDNGSNRTDDRGRRSYVADIPIGIDRVTVALFPAAQLGTPVDGRPRFTSNIPTPANAGVSIEVLDGQTIDRAGGTSDVVQVNGVRVGSDGTVSFTIDSTVVASIVPVVYEDDVNPTQDQLDLESGATSTTPRLAREAVGVGGTTSWGPPEPALRTDLSTGTVREVGPGWYTLDTSGGSSAEYLLRHTGGDDFRYTASNEPVSNSPGPITRSQFEAWLSPGDRVNPSAYDPGRMTHTLTGDVPATPTNLAAFVQGDGSVRLTFTKPTNPVADDKASSFRLQRATVTGGSVGSFVEVASRAGDQSAEFTNTPSATGTYAYRVLARSGTGDSPPTMIVQVTVAAPAPASTGSRVALDNGPSNSGGANGLLDHGDRLEVTFDRAVTVTSGWNVVLLDRDGTQVRLESPNVTPQVSGTASNVLTFHIGTGTLTTLVPGGVGGFDISTSTSNAGTTGFVQVLSSTAIGNVTGGWNLPKSGLGSPYNNSRVIVDGTGGGALTPPAPGGHLIATVAGSKLEAGLDEVQTVTAATGATGGTWTLTIGGKTATLDATDGAAAIQTELEALSSVGAGNVAVTGGPIGSTAVTVRFTGTLGAAPQPTMVVDGAGLTGPGGVTAPTVSTVTDGLAATGIVAGDRVTVYSTAGTLIGVAIAGANGRTTVSLAPPVVAGQSIYVVVEQQPAPYGRRSRTQIVVVS